MNLQEYNVQYRNSDEKLTVGAFRAYTELDLQQVMRGLLGYSPSSYQIVEHQDFSGAIPLNGIIIKHTPAPELYGGVAVRTDKGNYAILKEFQTHAAKNIGASVVVQPTDGCYRTVMIKRYN